MRLNNQGYGGDRESAPTRAEARVVSTQAIRPTLSDTLLQVLSRPGQSMTACVSPVTLPHPHLVLYKSSKIHRFHTPPIPNWRIIFVCAETKKLKLTLLSP